MAKKVTIRTKFKKGDIVRYKIGYRYFVGIVVHEGKWCGQSGFVFLKITPTQCFKPRYLKKIRVDNCHTKHLHTIIEFGGEIIKPIELVGMYLSSMTLFRCLIGKKRLNETEIKEILDSVTK